MRPLYPTEDSGSTLSSCCANRALLQIYQSYLDKATPYTTYRWIGTAVLLSLFFVRILLAQGWYIGKRLHQQADLKSRDHSKNSKPSTDIVSISVLFARNLPPQSLPRIPPAQIRPFPYSRRRHRRR